MRLNILRPICDLFGRHPGEAAWIVGAGPSLLHLRPEHISGKGPIIAINLSLPHVESLALPNAIYSMQKDGCLGSRFRGLPDDHRCGDLVVAPKKPDIPVLLHEFSKNCLRDHPSRFYFTCGELCCGLHSISAILAVSLARRMGCGLLTLVAFDGATSGDIRSGVGKPDNEHYIGQRTATLAALDSLCELVEPQPDGTLRRWSYLGEPV